MPEPTDYALGYEDGRNIGFTGSFDYCDGFIQALEDRFYEDFYENLAKHPDKTNAD